MPINQAPHNAIFDELRVRQIPWSGRFNEVEFLERLYELSQMPSKDPRFRSAAGDIYQHRVNWQDWTDDWIFQDERFDLYYDDERFVRFLAETVHPAVRPNTEQVTDLVDTYNHYLRADGWELVQVSDISGRPVYGAQKRSPIPSPTRQIEQTVVAGDFHYLDQQIRRMHGAIAAGDPDLAIGTAKELVETVCKTILQDLNGEFDTSWSLGRMFKAANESLGMSSFGDDAHPEAVRRITGGLNTVVAGLSELRNEFGTGHGRVASSTSLDGPMARMAVGAASTIAFYLFERYNEIKKRDGVS